MDSQVGAAPAPGSVKRRRVPNAAFRSTLGTSAQGASHEGGGGMAATQEQTLPTPAQRKRIREQAGWSQRQIVEKLGCSTPLVSNYERGALNPAGGVPARARPE